jgi:DNA polymerase I-like protein with 3'-5' exonuclease and polymerase domains
MYGAGPHKIWSEINSSGGKVSMTEASEIIDEYFEAFPDLKKWINATKLFLKTNKFIYSHFGRKRRLTNMDSKNKGMIDHEIRSGLNFMVQSPASDINLLGAVEAHNILVERKLNAKIFALVHDSILAEVRNDQIDEYKLIVTKCIQKDRGISIYGCPIGLEFDVHKDYSIGKFEKVYPELYAAGN